jgi:peptidoglycan/LPS O-acetylase OafA/YrhL
MIAANAPRISYRADLDGLRALAVGLVILAHMELSIGVAGGDVGVTAFFVLSGYLITGLLLDERDRTGRIDLRAFYGRRIRRLGPALLALLAVVVLIGVVAGWPTNWSLSLVSTLLYVSNWVQASGATVGVLGHTWSLSIEEQFYLLWPAFLIVAGARRAAFVAVAIVIAIGIVRVVADGPTEYFSTITRGDAVLVGCLLSIGRVRLPTWFAAAGVVTMVALTLTNLAHDIAIPIAILSAGGVVCAPWQPLARLAPMGRRAYGLYLWNWPLAVFFGILAVPLTFIAAELSWRLIEQPVARRRARSLRAAIAEAARLDTSAGSGVATSVA